MAIDFTRQNNMIELTMAKPTFSVKDFCSSGKWEAIKNSSWSEKHVSEFGNRPGYVICHRNRNRELVAVASVIGMPFVDQKEIDSNAKLIEAAPQLLDAVLKLSLIDENNHGDISELIKYAKTVVNKLCNDTF